MSVKFDNVTYLYNKKQKPALSNVSVDFSSNEIIFIMGHSGSGKSTFIEHINGLLFTKYGNIHVKVADKEYRIYKKQKLIKNVRKNVGMVFQFPENQLFESTVLKDTMFGPLNFGFEDNEAEKLAKNSLLLMGINEGYYSRLPYSLSGGEKRKVAIAGVLASKPEILVFDEPTSSLDKKSVKEFFEIVKRLKEKGLMIIIVSHNVDLAYEYADKILLLSKGKVSYFGDYKRAFDDEMILKESGVEKPFVLKVKEKLSLSNNARNITQLAAFIKGVSNNE